ncbi:MAG: hypothetical protein NVSMB9_12370 [Isosphaeraceae bacterium]
MDQVSLVQDRIGDGRRFVERFAADGNPVDAAFWVKASEEDSWFLYVATDLVDREGPAAAYRAVHASLDKLGDKCLSSSEIKIVRPSNPLALGVKAIMGRKGGRSAPRFDGRILGQVAVDQTYIYPSHVFTFTQTNPMTTEDIGQEILRIMTRGTGSLKPSRVVLKDGTSFNGVPFSLQVGRQKAVEVQFVEDRELAPRVIPLEGIASIA